jgi:hypothetical protein
MPALAVSINLVMWPLLKGNLGLATLPCYRQIALKIFANLGEVKGEWYPSNAQKWATAAAVELATPADPDRSAKSTRKISSPLISGGIVDSPWKMEKATHLSHRREYFSLVDGFTLFSSISSTLEPSNVALSSSVTMPKSS